MAADNDFSNNQLINAVLQVVGADVARGLPAVGKVVYDTRDANIYVCTSTSPNATQAGGGTWSPLSGGSWTTFTPSLTASVTNPTLGTTGSLATGRYLRLGKLIVAEYFWRFGSGMSRGSGNYRFAKPVNSANTTAWSLGAGHIVDNSTGATEVVSVENLGADKVDLLYRAATAPAGLVTDTQPWTWAQDDYMTFTITYEAA